MKDISSFAVRNLQRGGVILMVAGSLVMIAGMTALAVDVGRVMVVRNELQNVADAAALSGAGKIGNIFDQHWEVACTAAQQIIASNAVEKKALVVGDYTIQTGVWSDAGKSFTTVVDCNAGPALISSIPAGSFPAIRVLAKRNSSSVTGPLKMFFAPIIGADNVSLSADAIAAIAASGSAKPELPFALSDCILEHLSSDDGGLMVGKSFNVFSAQFNKKDGAGNDTDEIDTDKTIVCNENQAIGQWTPFCDDPGCESASKVANLLENPDDAPVFDESLILTELKNGRVQSLFNILSGILRDMPSGEKLVVLVPVVDNALLANGETDVAILQEFVSLEIKKVGTAKPEAYTGGGTVPYIEFVVASPKKYLAGTPDMSGSPFSGVTTKAFLVN